MSYCNVIVTNNLLLTCVLTLMLINFLFPFRFSVRENTSDY